MQTYINSNMTAREAFNQYGALPETMLETLLDASELKEKACEILPNIEEARGCYPAEDFMQEEITQLSAIVRGMRKSGTKDQLLQCIENLEQLQSLKANEADYGRQELQKALDVLYWVDVA